MNYYDYSIEDYPTSSKSRKNSKNNSSLKNKTSPRKRDHKRNNVKKAEIDEISFQIANIKKMRSLNDENIEDLEKKKDITGDHITKIFSLMGDTYKNFKNSYFKNISNRIALWRGDDKIINVKKKNLIFILKIMILEYLFMKIIITIY